MICQRCGHSHERGVWYVAVYPPMPSFTLSGAGEVLDPGKRYKKWSCESCGQDHFADGSLFYDPYRTSWAAHDCPCCHRPAVSYTRVGDRIHGWEGIERADLAASPPILCDLNRLRSVPVPRLV